MRETDLYPPIKAFLEARGFEVKGDLADCDVVARRGEEAPLIVELKRALTLELVLQGVGRQRSGSDVYLAFPVQEDGKRVGAWKTRRKEILRLCRMLGLGLLTVAFNASGGARVEAQLEPGPYQPRPDARRRKRLLTEFTRRQGDPMLGGGAGRAMLTAYRQDALRCARHLAAAGPSSPAALRAATGVDRAAGILQRDVYGWFERVSRGVYQLTPAGAQGLDAWAEALEAL